MSKVRKEKITLESLLSQFENTDYYKFYNWVKSLELEGKLIPIEGSGLNGVMLKPLYKRYWLISEEVDISNELTYLHPFLNTGYYKSKPEEYAKDSYYINKLSDYLYKYYEELEVAMAINERSFSVFGEEKFLKANKNYFKTRVGFEFERFNVYETPEPFVYYSRTKEAPQSIWIIENKDTWYTLRKLLLEGERKIFGVSIDTVIYIAGKGKVQGFNDFREAFESPSIVESQLLHKDNVFLYFGDLDYEGICMYESVKEKFKDILNIRLNSRLYEKMIDKYRERNIVLQPSNDNQNKNIKGIFISEIREKYHDVINDILESKKYIPQEILNYMDFKKGCKD